MKHIIVSILLVISSFSQAEAPEHKKTTVLTIYMPATKPVPAINIETTVINDLSVLHPLFRNKVVKMLYECAKQGIELEIVETYRHPIRQNYLRKQGFSMLGGGRSKHQYYIAVDVVPVKYGWYLWHDRRLWCKIGKIGEAQGLIWGGRWKRFYDPGHFEYPVHIDSVHTLHIPDTVLIPIR